MTPQPTDSEFKELIDAEAERLRQVRTRAWKENWCIKNDVFKPQVVHNRAGADIDKAPEPPTDLLPHGVVAVRWSTGYALIDADAFVKIPQSKLKILTGGK